MLKLDIMRQMISAKSGTTFSKISFQKAARSFTEIVGYIDENTPIMASVSNDGVKEKEFTKKFGKQTIFSYGCAPGESDMYVYRMTATTADGTVVEVPWETVEIWCDRMVVKHVPDLEKFIFTTNEDLIQRIKKYNEGMPADEIGKTHVS